MRKGSVCPELEVLGPDTLPFTCYSSELRPTRQPIATREPEMIRRLRTSTEAELSTAYVPSYVSDSGLLGPSDPTFESGSHESGSGAYFAADK